MSQGSVLNANNQGKGALGVHTDTENKRFYTAINYTLSKKE